MLKKKSIKVLLAWLLIAVILIPYISPVIATENSNQTASTTETKKLNSAFQLTPSDWGYKMGPYASGILFLLEDVDGNGQLQATDTFFCLDRYRRIPRRDINAIF